MKLQNTNNQAPSELKLRLTEIAQAIYHVNQIVAYPLSDTQIIDWSVSINEQYPKIDVKYLKMLIDKMKAGQIDWDKSKGIQNIFIGLQTLKDLYLNRKPDEVDLTESQLITKRRFEKGI